jgi:hypothetical protein
MDSYESRSTTTPARIEHVRIENYRALHLTDHLGISGMDELYNRFLALQARLQDIRRRL